MVGGAQGHTSVCIPGHRRSKVTTHLSVLRYRIKFIQGMFALLPVGPGRAACDTVDQRCSYLENPM